MPLAKVQPATFDPAAHTGNVHQAFTDWIESWDMWYEVASMGELSADATAAEKLLHKSKVFRMCVFQGDRLKADLKAEFNQVLADLKAADFDTMVARLTQRYQPTQNQVLLHFQFHGLRQEPAEKIDSFINRVRQHADKCAFKCTNDRCTEKDKIYKTLIRDQIVVGTTSRSIREDALEKERELDALVTQARKIEATMEATQIIAEDDKGNSVPAFDINTLCDPNIESDVDCQETSINKIGKKGGRYSIKQHRKFQQVEHATARQCYGCGDPKCDRGPKCRARGKFCNNCGRKDHFSSVCMSKGANMLLTFGSATVNSLNDESPPQSKLTDISLAGCSIKAMIDTGAEVNVILESQVPAAITRLHRTDIRLQPYGSPVITPKGQFTVDTSWNSHTQRTSWVVVDDDDLPGKAVNLISCNLAESLGLITFNSTSYNGAINTITLDTIPNAAIINLKDSVSPSIGSIIDQHPSVFQGLGKMKAEPIQLHVQSDASPVIQPPRPIPYHLKARFDSAIHDMEKDNVIEEHTGPVTWLSNPVLVPKPDGSIRVTVDLRNLNKALQDTHLPIPRVEDILPMFAGKTVFSKLDLRTAFHQLELTTDSKALTVFRAGERLMRYKRLTMGTLPASGELNHRVRPIIANIPNAEVIQDDIVIAETDNVTHDNTFRLVIIALERAGLTVNPSKCIIGQLEIPFWGFLVNKDGIRPDPAKVQAVQEAGRPTTKDELRSFLCMIRSNGAFIPDLAAATANLRELTKQNILFQWNATHEKEFRDIQNAFTTDVLLRHYDMSQHTFIFVDAHITGLCAILTQGPSIDQTKAVALSSRTTTTAEQNYSQLDLEATAIDFGLRQFRHILTGGPQITVVTDQQPLESLWKSKRKPSARLERILLRHQDINHKVVWRKGKDNPADFLSRHAIPLQKLPQHVTEEAAEHEKILFILHNAILTSTAITKERLRNAQLQDAELAKLRHYVALGQAPRNDPDLRCYFQSFSELSVDGEGIIYKGDQMLLPTTLREEAISLAHTGSHPGQDAVKRRLRAHFWFPGIDDAINQQIGSCHQCQVRTASPITPPLTPTSIPDRPWQKLSIDLFGPLPDQQHILVVRCNLCRFPDAKVVRSTGSKHVLPALGEIYQSFGNPECHKCDNGPPFNGQEFRQWSADRGINIKSTYPYHPQGNEAECFMKPLKKAVQIALEKKRPIQEAVNELLGDYRSTPHPATGLAPGEMLFRGGYRSKFPSRPCITDDHVKMAKQRDAHRKEHSNAKVNSSRWRKYLDIIQGDKVLVKRATGRTKYRSLFEQIPYTVTDVQGGRYELVPDNDKDNTRPIFRHLSDIKPYKQQQDSETHHLPPLKEGHEYRSWQESEDVPLPLPVHPEPPVAAVPPPPETTIAHPQAKPCEIPTTSATSDEKSRTSTRAIKPPPRFDDYVIDIPRRRHRISRGREEEGDDV